LRKIGVWAYNFRPMRFLVTAGNTREKIDRVRDWGNIFTGNTGYSIARALAALGEVDLITSNRQHLAEIERAPDEAFSRAHAAPRRLEAAAEQDASSHTHQIHGIPFTSHAELKKAIETALKADRYDAVFMSAAIADYRPAGSFQVVRREMRENGEEAWIVKNVQAGKVKSNYDQVAILGERTEKLVDLYRKTWAYRGVLVKFKLEVGIPREQLIEIGQASRKASGADYLIANTLEMVEGKDAGAFLLGDGGAEWIRRAELAARMAKLVRDALKSES
jgi:phosphopantothenate---cysteine ligase (CTP)